MSPSSSQQWVVFWNGDGPDDAACWEEVDSEQECRIVSNLKNAQGWAFRDVTYGSWRDVTYIEDPKGGHCDG